MRRAARAVIALVGVMTVAGVLAFWLTPASPRTASMVSTDGGRTFAVECTWSHRLDDDPIVHPAHAGASHAHDFFGSFETDADSTAAALLGTATSCQTSADTAAYWLPTLYRDGDALEPGRLYAYYRVPAAADPADVVTYPLGLAMVAGHASGSTPHDPSTPPADVVTWHCDATPTPFASDRPPRCPADAPLTLRVVFPTCWDGVRLDSDDHRSHLSYGSPDGCSGTHPTILPELVLDIAYPVVGEPGELRWASGDLATGHADFLNAWDPEALDRRVRSCLHRDEDCGALPSRTIVAPSSAGD